ncbi:23S rRNA (pseudouridine1915-N3)-methyltransferase [Lachnospiraceae bacterium A10]|nr:23S rRNA (pseudouridine1915-N3)-methyltransferase [Lachnospiraceae bacterium A10]
MNIKIICVGKVKEKFYRDAIAEYSKRLSRYTKFQIIEVSDEKTDENASEHENTLVKDKEGQRILGNIKDQDYVIGLFIQGKQLDSVELSEKMSKLFVSGTSNLVFVIGGSLGLSKEVEKRCNALLSLSKMTFPHQLMRVILTEQIYRAFRIMHNEPYHK